MNAKEIDRAERLVRRRAAHGQCYCGRPATKGQLCATHFAEACRLSRAQVVVSVDVD